MEHWGHVTLIIEDREEGIQIFVNCKSRFLEGPQWKAAENCRYKDEPAGGIKVIYENGI